MKFGLMNCLILASSTCLAEIPEKFIKAVHFVETSGRTGAILGDFNPKTRKYMALGPIQIHRACWQDSGVAGDYQQCANLDYSKKVMERYLKRYCPQAVKTNDFETMARVWNGGIQGHKRKATIGYWNRIKKHL